MLRFFKTKKVKATDQRKMKPFPVLIATPVPIMDHKISHGLSLLLSGCAARRIALPYQTPSRQAEFGRNAIIDDFLNRPELKIHTHLMFMDADTYPVDLLAVEKMLAHNKDVVAGATPVFLDDGEIPDIRWNIQTDESNQNLRIGEVPQKLFRAKRVGGTTILIKRHVLEALKPPYQKPLHDDQHKFFMLGEDYYFCDKIREAGFDIWVDPTIISHHWHTIDILRILVMIQELARQNGWNDGGNLFAKAIALLKDVFDRFSMALKDGMDFEPGDWEHTLQQIKELIKTVKVEEEVEAPADPKTEDVAVQNIMQGIPCGQNGCKEGQLCADCADLLDQRTKAAGVMIAPGAEA